MKNWVWRLDLNQAKDQDWHPDLLEPVQALSGEQTFDQVSNRLPEGVYTTLRTYRRYRALRLEQHFQRLEESAAMMGTKGVTVALPRDWLRSGMRQVIDSLPQLDDLRFRLTVDLTQQVGMLYINAGPLVTPSSEDYQHGVKLVTWDLYREMAQAKRTNFIPRADRVRAELPPDVYEAIMINPNGCLLEGLTSNFFTFLAGELYTASEGVLLGITRTLVLEAAQGIGWVVHMQALPREQLGQATEAFISSSSRGILPVRQIDEFRLGSAAPNALTRRLMEAFQARLQAELKLI